MKFITLISLGALPLLALTGCKSTKPGTDQKGPGGETDFTSMGQLPNRGDFNPESDVNYSELGEQAGGNNSNIIYFPTDSSTIAPAERPKLDRIYQWMQQNKDRSILAAGHCDERGTLEYNRALAERRAIAVRDYLMGLGAAGARIYTHSYGEERPAVKGAGSDAWAKNRRTELGVVAR
jgi:peptidoglycan-associated lipoprotein